jgi:hypothetical protein
MPLLSSSITYIHAILEDTEPLEPLEEARHSRDIDKGATEHHHADPDEGC